MDVGGVHPIETGEEADEAEGDIDMDGHDVEGAEEGGGFAEEGIEDVDGQNPTPMNSDIPGAEGQTPLRSPKTPRKSMATKTPRPIPKSAFASAKKHKKKAKKPRKSQLDISALTDEQVALAALQSNQILNLKLRKRYYAEALDFIRHVENAMEIIGQLLGSTNKAEVLESIEFFRVAHEYQIVGSEVSNRAFMMFELRSDVDHLISSV